MNQYAVPVVWSPTTREHDPRHEVWVGVATDGHRGGGAGRRDPRRACEPAGHRLVEATPHPDDVLLAVHDAALLELPRGRRRTAGVQGPYDELVGQDRVVPYLFPTPAMTGGLPARPAVAVHADAGRFAYDTMTLVGPGTWAAARAAVDCALTAADLVARRRAARLRAVPPARTPRDPGRLRRLVLPQQRGRRGRGAARRRARAGRGRRRRRPPRQRHRRDLLRPRPTCSTGRCTSTRAPAGSRTSSGYADETGTGAGAGATRNLPLPEGTADEPVARGRRRPRRVGGRRRAARRWWSRSASTPRPTTPRARCWSPTTATGRPARCSARPGCRPSSVQEGGYHLPTPGRPRRGVPRRARCGQVIGTCGGGGAGPRFPTVGT